MSNFSMTRLYNVTHQSVITFLLNGFITLLCHAKSTENILMKLDIWIDGSMEIMHVFFFSSYVENSGCYGIK
jgi:hypothetical protein